MVIEVATVIEDVVPEAMVVNAVMAERSVSSVAAVANMTAAVAPA
jgi:hypothetical protein